MLNAASEKVLRKAIADMAAVVTDAGNVQPSPLYFVDAADFWNTTAGNVDTRDEIDTECVAGLWIYPLQFVDDFTSGGIDSPLVNLTYEFYLFRQYARTREDEGDTPQLFESKCLEQHNKFVSAWLGLKSEFQGKRAIPGLDPLIFATVKTTSLTQPELIDNQAECEFVPQAVGFAVRLQCVVEVKLVAC